MISHANLLHNAEAIRNSYALDESHDLVSWLPLFHDMGLIGGVLEVLYIGSQAVLMSPAAFLQRPSRWFASMSHFRAAVSIAPNFAFELCTRRIAAATVRHLDLSSWSLAVCGA
jgi:acyl-CoA synthetase (AMP-forming)/AMP-acid ligase II